MAKPNSNTWLSQYRGVINGRQSTDVGAFELGRYVYLTSWNFAEGEATNQMTGEHFGNNCDAFDDMVSALDNFITNTPTQNGMLATFTIVLHLSEVQTLMPAGAANAFFRQFPASNVFEYLEDYFAVTDLTGGISNAVQGSEFDSTGTYRVRFTDNNHGLDDDDAITVSNTGVTAYNRRHKVRFVGKAHSEAASDLAAVSFLAGSSG